MVNLVIDIGNAFAKVAIFNNRTLSKHKIFEDFSVNALREFLENEVIDHAIVSSVDKEFYDIEAFLKSKYNYIRFHAGVKSNIKNQYKSPETLGLDRFAAVIGVQSLFPKKNCLIIDAGTCITYDFTDDETNYYGGSISPGIAMRFKALHTFTERLPLVDFDDTFAGFYGTNTHGAILSGVQHGILNEAVGFIQTYVSQYPDLQIVLCGGDVKFFDTRLKSSIFADAVKTEPHLVLIGLNEVIYQYND